ncbi:MAG: 3-hydroxyacyl-[acyl-carrier-protein] dehydratase, partial [Clostridiales bacterium]|nr:3-hydroxyacyl-[acyl-carrier-protein] dehydratase [Clostridiales bacterium]
MNKEAIKKIIPHRDPMLLIDEVIEMQEGESLTAKFLVNADREIFRGHFPEEPVFPGVYTVECMAQAADILLLSMPKYQNTIPFFIGINNVKFKAKIKPGDEIVIRVTLT